MELRKSLFPADIHLVLRSGAKRLGIKAREANALDLSEERAEQIVLEETLPRRRRTRDRSDEETVYRRLIARDVARLTKAGVIIDIPARWPDLSEPDEVEVAQDAAVADGPAGGRLVAYEAADEALEEIVKGRNG